MLAHLFLTTHAVCSEHGEIAHHGETAGEIYRAIQPWDLPVTSRRDDSPQHADAVSASPTLAAGDSPQHADAVSASPTLAAGDDHCLPFGDRTSPAETHRPAWVRLSRIPDEPRPPVEAPQCTLVSYRLAPKTSPPRA